MSLFALSVAVNSGRDVGRGAGVSAIGAGTIGAGTIEVRVTGVDVGGADGVTLGAGRAGVSGEVKSIRDGILGPSITGSGERAGIGALMPLPAPGR